MQVHGFDWDDGNREKCQRHGVTIAEIEALLSGTPRIVPDLAHSTVEDRLIAVGLTSQGRAIFVAFTFRAFDGRYKIRPISARYMHDKERRAYGQDGPEAYDR